MHDVEPACRWAVCFDELSYGWKRLRRRAGLT